MRSALVPTTQALAPSTDCPFRTLRVPRRLSVASCQTSYTLISTSTPAGRSSFIKESTVLLVELRMSIRRLWARVSNCSLDFLSTCGDRSTVYTVRFVGNGIGPETTAPVDFTVLMIFSADLSIRLWSNDFSFMRIFCPANVNSVYSTETTVVEIPAGSPPP